MDYYKKFSLEVKKKKKTVGFYRESAGALMFIYRRRGARVIFECKFANVWAARGNLRARQTEKKLFGSVAKRVPLII